MRRLEVLLHDEPVGLLAEDTGGGVEFRFLPRYREMVPRPVLGQKFEDDLDRTHRSRPRTGLPDFFANLIPEGRLREVILEAASLEPGDDLSLLHFVGRDLAGAVTVREAPGTAEANAFPPRTSIDDEVLGPPGDDDSDALHFSVAGVQLKFSMLLEGEKLTLPARGDAGEWIVKFDSPSFPNLPENEYSMLAWARDAGFDVPEHRLLDVDAVVGLPRRYGLADTRVLAVRRYDRRPEGRVHQEDFAQAIGLPPSKKYRQLTYEAMVRLATSFIGEEGAEELLRRLALMVATGNNDAHLKNWSMIYPDRIQARWSPLYDQVATVAWPGTDRELSLKLAGVKAFGRIDREAFERLAQKAQIDSGRTLELVAQTLDRLRSTWHRIARELPMVDAHRRAVEEHWRSVPLLREHGLLATR